jgi:hypothetical protein
MISELGCSRTDVEADLLLTLFSALDSVLQLLARRGRQAFHSVVRTDVESVTGRELSDDRLRRVLSIAGPNLIDIKWITSGRSAMLEIFQRDEHGNKRFPTLEEMSHRKEEFKVALNAAWKTGQLPFVVSLEKPAPAPAVQVTPMPALPTPEVKIATIHMYNNTKGADASTRKESLLERVKARERQAAELRVRQKEYDAIRRKIGVCDDAEIAHKVLQSLFARGEGKNSGASEEEVLQALSSASFGMQCTKTLDRPAAQDALALLVEKCSQWFIVQAGVHNPRAKYLRRLPQARPADALAAVQAERLNLKRKLQELCETEKKEEEGGMLANVIGKGVSLSRSGSKRPAHAETGKINSAEREKKLQTQTGSEETDRSLLKRPRLHKKTKA